MINSKVSDKIDPNILRQTAGAFATGVTIITVDHEDEMHGMTANSFVSVSLDPALVMFSVRNEAQILSAISVGKAIGINILQESQKAISDHFAGIENSAANPSFETIHDSKILKGCLAYYCCQVDRIIECGDHQLILCKVIICQRNEGKPLLYYSGYSSLGDPI